MRRSPSSETSLRAPVGGPRPAHHDIARGEAMECAASLDVMRLRKVITDAQYERGGQLLEGVVAMLTKMV